jgi:hypothetical protein
VVTIDGSLDAGSVEAADVTRHGEDLDGVDLEGRIEAIDLVRRTLTVTADDDDTSGASLTISVPASFDLSLFHVGQAEELIVSPNPDGTFTLEQSSDDSGAAHADDPHEIQGDDPADQQAQGDDGSDRGDSGSG